jgi:hypothetical protein
MTKAEFLCLLFGHQWVRYTDYLIGERVRRYNFRQCDRCGKRDDDPT